MVWKGIGQVLVEIAAETRIISRVPSWCMEEKAIMRDRIGGTAPARRALVVELTVMMQVFLLAALSVSSCAGTPPKCPGLSDRLKLPAAGRLLIVHADDVGMCHAANEAAIKGMEQGAITSGSIMVPCPWFPEIATYAREHPGADLGIHLTLTSEWENYRWGPVSQRSLVPGLLDPDGYFWHDVEGVVAHAKPGEVEAELRAQIRKALDAGLNPTHLDSHMGAVFASEDFVRIYLKLALEFGVVPMLPRLNDEMLAGLRNRGFNNPGEFAVQVGKEGFLFVDRLVTGVEGAGYAERCGAYNDVIDSLAPGVTQIIIHPACESGEIEAITGSYRVRNQDFAYFGSADAKRRIEDSGVTLIGWRPLQNAWMDGLNSGKPAPKPPDSR
jgi:predicted glycoside hydrolase/deacetylase ChbG (UPF0249 family)